MAPPRGVVKEPRSDFIGTWNLETAEPGSKHDVMEARGDGTRSCDRDFRVTRFAAAGCTVKTAREKHSRSAGSPDRPLAAPYPRVLRQSRVAQTLSRVPLGR